MGSADEGVLLIDWDNLAGAISGRGKVVERRQVDDLYTWANGRCREQLHHSHMAANRFDPTIILAMQDRGIVRETVRSTKEQADILLTVLAMDYLHAGVGHFFLVTGDQDFIPLIHRLKRAGRKVTVVYGDEDRLSRELRHVLTSPGHESLDINDVSPLREREPDTGCRSLLGLLELQRRGVILGGQEQGGRTGLLSDWGVIENADESQYWLLVNAVTEKVRRIDAARMERGKWLPQAAFRTYLALGQAALADITAIDHAVRWISSRPRGVPISGLRNGPFRTDSGVLLERTLDALLAIRLIRKQADGTLSLVGPPLQLGYLEQLWRVFAGVSAECYRRHTGSIPFGQLEPLLARRGIGQAPEQRAAGRIREAVNYAKAAGVIDSIAVDERRHVQAPYSPLSEPFELAYYEFYGAFADRHGEEIAEDEVIATMETRDEARPTPHFGFEPSDRHRFLRILSQAQLITRRDGRIVVVKSDWGETGRDLRR